VQPVLIRNDRNWARCLQQTIANPPDAHYKDVGGSSIRFAAIWVATAATMGMTVAHPNSPELPYASKGDFSPRVSCDCSGGPVSGRSFGFAGGCG
jgi:hypothetical protein